MAALVVFIIATLEIIFGQETQLDETGPFGDNVFKNPARCKRSTIVAETGLDSYRNRQSLCFVESDKKMNQ